MNASTFKAQTKLITNRWPFGDATEAQSDYMDRLWAKVCDWKGDHVEAFRDAVEALVASNHYGRPTVDGIVALARSKVGGPPPEADEAPATKQARALRHYLETGYLTIHSSRAAVVAAIGCRPDEVGPLWERLVRFHDCHACNFGMALVVLAEKDGSAWFMCLSCSRTHRRKDGALGVAVAFDGAEDWTAEEHERGQHWVEVRKTLNFRGLVKSFELDEGFPDDDRSERVRQAMAPHTRRATER